MTPVAMSQPEPSPAAVADVTGAASAIADGGANTSDSPQAAHAAPDASAPHRGQEGIRRVYIKRRQVGHECRVWHRVRERRRRKRAEFRNVVAGARNAVQPSRAETEK